MNRRLLYFTVLFLGISNFLCAQNLKGIWKGHFFSDDGEQYRYEVQLQKINDSLSGVTYAFQDVKFYGKATFTGKVIPSTKTVFLQELKTEEVRMQKGFHSCILKCNLTYVQSGREEFLEGTYTSFVETTESLMDVKRGDDCGGGKMYLRKVLSSDFELEPFLVKKQIEKPLPATPKKIVPPSTTKNNLSKIQTTPLPFQDQKKISPNVIVKIKPADSLKMKSPVLKPVMIPFALKSRENKLAESLIFSSKEVTIKIFDNGEIDDDSISVYLDNRLLLSKKRLTAQALTINFTLDEAGEEHELVLVAENLGRIPPNTALMIVSTPTQRFELRITSTAQKNALVRFKYVKP